LPSPAKHSPGAAGLFEDVEANNGAVAFELETPQLFEFLEKRQTMI
jgi:hypothetical protein